MPPRSRLGFREEHRITRREKEVKFYAGSKVQVTFHRSRVQGIAPSINYQTTQIPLDLIEHFVKRLGLGDSFNAVHLSLSW